MFNMVKCNCLNIYLGYFGEGCWIVLLLLQSVVFICC